MWLGDNPTIRSIILSNLELLGRGAGLGNSCVVHELHLLNM